MTTEQKTEIVKLIEERMGNKKLSQNETAPMIGLSPATLSNMLNGKWDLIKDKMWLKAAGWVGMGGKRWKIKETENLKSVYALCVDAQENSRLLALAAETGFGKTEGLKYYTSKTEGCYYTLCTKTMNRRELLNAICKSMGLVVEGSLHKQLYAIINHLRTLETPLLILDDFGKLPDNCQLLIQIVYDELEGLTGIVLAGTNAFQHDLFKLAAKDKAGFRELKRRIAYWQPLRGVTMGFIKSAALDFGITEQPALEYIKTECTDFGSVKELLINYSKLIERLHATTGEPQESQRELLTQIHFGNHDLKAAA